MEFGCAPAQSEPRFDAMVAQARLAESLGFDVLWANLAGFAREQAF